MNLAERIAAFHDRAASLGGGLGRLLFGVRVPLLYPLLLLVLLLFVALPPGEPPTPKTVALPPPATEVDVMPRVYSAPPMPEPLAEPAVPAAPVESPKPSPRPAVGNGNADWLLSLPPEGYTLQLLGSRHEKTLRAFVRRHGLESMTAYYRTRHNGGEWFVLLYGLYTDRDEASVAVGTLPPAVRKNAPFPRTIRSVQKAIREGR